MLHVVTVHWRSDEWIAPQLHFLALHAPVETRVWAALNGIAPERRSLFHYAEDLDGSHAEKLNALAARVVRSAEPDDHLLFLDGDAFPIAPLRPLLHDPAPLVAVRRDENLLDPQPHPCFCLTTIRFWQDLGGDWRAGYKWRNATGDMVTDVGGNLLGLLRERGVDWRPLLRSNRIDLHPLWFAVYGNVAYHHGAGFRERMSRIESLGQGLNPHRASSGALIPRQVPVLARIERRIRRRRAAARLDRWQRSEGTRQLGVAREVYQQILEDDSFHRRFTD